MTNWREIESRGSNMRDAIINKTSWIICWRKGDVPHGAWDGEYWPIGLANLKHVIHAARRLFPRLIGRRVFIEKPVGGGIGCLHVEPRGSMIL